MSVPLLQIALLIATVLALAGLAAGAWGLRAAAAERRRLSVLEAELAAAQSRAVRAEALAEAAEAAKTQVGDAFKAMSAEALEKSAADLLKRAEEAFASRDRLAQERLHGQLKPVAETLTKFQEHVAALEKARVEETGGLKAQIAALMQASVETQGEARKLSAALRRGAGVQGRWGEQTLRNVLEAAGLQNRFDFEEQFSVETEEGRRRPDVKVKMPGGGVFAIDAKASLNAFLEAQECPDDATREQCLARHAQSLKQHMQGLSAKAYWDQFKAEGSPDFVAMFVPGDGFLAAALERQPDLLSDAMDKRVLIVTPTTLFALCKAVAYGWRAEEQTVNAAKVASLGKELYKRLSVMGGHAAAVGKALDSAVGKYNQFVGSLESQVMVSARRFEELSVDHEGKDLPELTAVEQTPRALSRPELVAPEKEPAQ